MDKYTATHQIRLLQERAEAEPKIADAVSAYIRLCTDRGAEPTFYSSEAEAEDKIKAVSFVHRNFVERNQDLDPRVLSFFVDYGEELAHRRLPVIFQPGDLAFKLGISMLQLNWLAYAKTGRYRRRMRKGPCLSY